MVGRIPKFGLQEFRLFLPIMIRILKGGIRMLDPVHRILPTTTDFGRRALQVSLAWWALAVGVPKPSYFRVQRTPALLQVSLVHRRAVQCGVELS